MATRQSEAIGVYNAAPWGSVTITPSDSTVLSPPLRRLYIGGAGNVAIRTMDGTVVVLTAPPVGTVIEAQIDQVRSTNTTATLMVGFY